MQMQTLSTGVRVYECAKWEDFISEVRSFHINEDIAAPRIFRGQADPTWELSSVWERTEKGYRELNSGIEIDPPERKKRRDQYLKDFKRISVGIPNFQSAFMRGDDDWWALGRHHGLNTPLLDWTYSPYVAAYFAAYEYFKKANPGFFSGSFAMLESSTLGNISIWGLVLAPEIRQLEEFKVIEDRIDEAYRQKAQQGIFTRLNHDHYLDLEKFLASKKLGRYLERYDITLSQVDKILKDLSLMNITPSSLFPDLEGAAKHANITQSLSRMGTFAKRQEEILLKLREQDK